MIDSLAKNVELLYFNMQNGLAHHNLIKEVELVINYIDIQQVRFNHSLNIIFNFQDPGIKNIQIPSMLMQIHVENAIEKGIRNREGANRLIINFINEINNIKIVIEDDGRGRTIKKDRNLERKSSTAVMNDLITIFNSYNHESISMSYDDLIFDNKYGTRVTIIIPKNFNYEFEKI
jgi:LytS/YehU family sensor histidine kinase